MNKIIPLLVVVLFLSSSLVGVSYPVEEIKEKSTISVDGIMNCPWPMDGYDRRHTGRSPYSTENNTGVEIWRFRCDWIMQGPVISEDGSIYFGDADRHLVALNHDGTLKWNFSVNDRVESSPAIADDGTIYIGANSFYAINPDGTLKWQLGVSGDLKDSPTIGNDGTIYFGSTGGKIYSINPNGTENWHFNTSDGVYSSPAIGDDGTIYVGSYDGNFHALHPNGTLRWQFNTNGIIRGSPTIADDGTIYIEGGGEMFALYPNGTKKWEVSVGMTHLSPSLGEDGTLYFGTGSYKFYAVNPDGTIKWKYDPGDHSALWESSAAISADGTIYFGTHVDYPYDGGGDIIALNPDGTEKWRKRIAIEWVDSSPAIGSDGTVYIGSISRDQGGGEAYGYLHAFNDGVPNHAPSAPVITGPSIGIRGKDYEYTFVSTDPDDEEIYYYVNWEASGSTSGWYGPFESGYVLTLSHSFGRGTSNLRAKARDPFGEDSDLTIMEVVMPKNKIINPFERFLENHPYMFPLLRQLLGLQ